MNKTQTKIDAGRYEAPKVRVKELRCRRMLCGSLIDDDGITSMEEDGNTEI